MTVVPGAIVIVLALAVVAAGEGSARTAASNGEIAFTRGGWIYVVSPGGGTPRKLVKGESPDWSPDGSKLAFDRNGVLFVSDANGQKLDRLTEDAYGPRWSPDGTRIAFTGYQYPYEDCIPTATYAIIWTISADGSDRKLFTPKSVAQETCSVPGGDTDPSWAPSGTRLVFTHLELVVHSQFDQVLLLAPLAGRPRQSLRRGFQADWSPNGKQIAFTTGHLYLTGLTRRSQRRRLTSGRAKDLRPTWSPDGTKLVFVRSGALEILDVRTKKVRKLTSGPSDRAPSWRPARSK